MQVEHGNYPHERSTALLVHNVRIKRVVPKLLATPTRYSRDSQWSATTFTWNCVLCFRTSLSTRPEGFRTKADLQHCRIVPGQAPQTTTEEAEYEVEPPRAQIGRCTVKRSPTPPTRREGQSAHNAVWPDALQCPASVIAVSFFSQDVSSCFCFLAKRMSHQTLAAAVGGLDHLGLTSSGPGSTVQSRETCRGRPVMPRSMSMTETWQTRGRNRHVSYLAQWIDGISSFGGVDIRGDLFVEEEE